MTASRMAGIGRELDKKHRLRRQLGVCLLGAFLGSAALPFTMAFAPVAHAQAGEQPPVQAEAEFDIPAGALADAIERFGEQSGLRILYEPTLAENVQVPAVTGRLRPRDALSQLLQGSGLTGVHVNDKTLVIRRVASAANQGANAGALAADDLPTDIAEDATAAAGPAGPADDAGTTASVESVRRQGIEEIIVTGQKKEERLQDVPIAISAFSAEQLDAQKIEGGFDLLKAVPNVTFSKSNYSSYNFSIRGVGTKAVSATADSGVAVSFNNVPLIRNRLFEQEYFDVERVEVLRGPQGTLYGRNATGGVVNMITNKPVFNEFQTSLKAEGGNYNSRRFSGMLNVPLIDDMLAVRFAASATQRDGYSYNEATGEDSDNRDLWSSRLTIGFRPTERVRADLIWEHFKEDDERLRTGKQLCHRDPGPENLPGVEGGPIDLIARGRLGQGCKIGSLYDAGAYGTPNGWTLPFAAVLIWNLRPVGYDPDTGRPISLMRRDVNPYGDLPQSQNLRSFYSIIDPKYQAEADVLALNLDIDISDTLVLSSQTAYNEDRVWSLQDYMRFETQPVLADTDLLDGINGPGTAYLVDLPGGYYNDPQVGPANSLKGFEVSSSDSYQFSQEFRLQSDFDGPVNFSVGANYLRFKGINDYYLFFNILTLFADSFYNNGKPYDPTSASGIPIDTSPFEQLKGDGHNYFRNQNPYWLESKSIFGELYWNLTDTLKMTAGLRYTDDRKRFTPWPSHLMVTNARDSAYGPDPDITLGWSEITGRWGLDWQLDLPFTDQTMVYGFYSRGYKGGGMNPPASVADNTQFQSVVPAIFDPEYVTSTEIGVKNTLLGGTMMLNGTVFHYDYSDYQVSKVQDRTIVNENFDAKVWGLELESLWRPVPEAAINATVGYLRTKLASDERSLDIANRTQGREGWMTISPWVQQTSNCIIPASFAAEKINEARAIPYLHDMLGGDVGRLVTACVDFWGNPDNASLPGAAEANGGQGFMADIGGNDLPNSPRWTLALGAEYTVPLFQRWALTARGDYYRQASSWSRVYQESGDYLRSWDNLNLSLTLASVHRDLAVQLYVKNVMDETPITDAFLNSDSTGLSTNIFTLDPRLVGVSVRVGF